MKKFVLFILLFLLTLTCFPASAQDIDVDNMSNAELMALLQSIMLKMEQNSQTETVQETEKATEEPEPVIVTDPASVIETVSQVEPTVEKPLFEVYENKKLVIGKMPDSYFIRIEKGGGEEEKKDDGGGTPYDPIKEPSTNPEPGNCFWSAEQGRWICPKG